MRCSHAGLARSHSPTQGADGPGLLPLSVCPALIKSCPLYLIIPLNSACILRMHSPCKPAHCNKLSKEQAASPSRSRSLPLSPYTTRTHAHIHTHTHTHTCKFTNTFMAKARAQWWNRCRRWSARFAWRFCANQSQHHVATLSVGKSNRCHLPGSENESRSKTKSRPFILELLPHTCLWKALLRLYSGAIQALWRF
jgi:hypothetical protein